MRIETLLNLRSFQALNRAFYSTMPPKRKFLSSNIPPNAASAVAYTDSSGSAANKRSRVSKPLNSASPQRQSTRNGDITSYASNGVTKPSSTPNGTAASSSEPIAATTNGRGFEADEQVNFDHSRPEERSGIVDRRFYPHEMSNERCAMYNANEIPRPMEVLDATLSETKTARDTASKTSGEAVIHWFKRDLRVRDNTGLSMASDKAKELGVGLIGLWILSEQDWQAHLVSPAKCDFELRSLDVLKKELAELDIPLHIEVIPSRKNIPSRITELAEEWEVKNIYCNLEYEIDELRREEKLVKLCLEKGIQFEPVHDDCVVPPGSLETGGGKQYAVYSPWFRAWVAYLHSHPEVLNERPMPRKNPAGFKGGRFKGLFNATIPDAPDSKKLKEDEKKRFASLWPAGENAALDRLEHFLTEKVGVYKDTRNFPAKNSTARVSVHHAAGTLAARTSVRMARDVNSTKKLDGGNEGIKGWISEVAWRDFYRHVLVHWPYIWYVCPLYSHICSWRCTMALTIFSMNKPFKYEYTNIQWEYNPDHFQAWAEGRTGYPLVDAAMRSLNHTAYMHNRVRMVTASFLAKHLLLDWRLGEQYFISHLIDGDFASNSGGWGFSSSTGVDPQPYFRVFNPWLQSDRFDADGDFIRQWVPELADVEGNGVHNPYEAGGQAEKIAAKNGYPKPIVEHKFARGRCLERYKSGIGRETA